MRNPQQAGQARTLPWREKKCSSAYGGSGRESMVNTVRPSSAGPDSASQSTSESARSRPAPCHAAHSKPREHVPAEAPHAAGCLRPAAFFRLSAFH